MRIPVKQFFRGVQRKAVDFLSLDRMGEKYMVLATNYIFLMFYTTLEGVFVNTFLYSISPGMNIVISYRAVTYIASACMMHVAAYISQKKTPLLVIRLGALFYLLTYASLFIGMNYMEKIRFFVAFLSGTGGAFYWTAHNIFVTHYTNKGNRDLGISIMGIIQGVMTLLCPVISGFVIKLMPGDWGYRVMFGIGMMAVIAQIFVQARLHPVVKTNSGSEMRLALKLMRRYLANKLMLVYEFMRGMRDGTFAFILNMLLFEIITDESLVGFNTFLTGAAAIGGSWLFGKLVRVDNRPWFAAGSAGILLLVCSSLFLKMNAPMVMVFSILNALLQLFILYSCNNTTFDVVVQDEDSRKCMGETMAIREGAMAGGRLLGLLIVAVFPATQVGYVQSMGILTAAQFIVAIFLGLTHRVLQRGPTNQKGEAVT